MESKSSCSFSRPASSTISVLLSGVGERGKVYATGSSCRCSNLRRERVGKNYAVGKIYSVPQSRFGWPIPADQGQTSRTGIPPPRPPSFAGHSRSRELRRDLAEVLAEAGRALPAGRPTRLGATPGLSRRLQSL